MRHGALWVEHERPKKLEAAIAAISIFAAASRGQYDDMTTCRYVVMSLCRHEFLCGKGDLSLWTVGRDVRRLIPQDYTERVALLFQK